MFILKMLQNLITEPNFTHSRRIYLIGVVRETDDLAISMTVREILQLQHMQYFTFCYKKMVFLPPIATISKVSYKFLNQKKKDWQVIIAPNWTSQKVMLSHIYIFVPNNNLQKFFLFLKSDDYNCNSYKASM